MALANVSSNSNNVRRYAGSFRLDYVPGKIIILPLHSSSFGDNCHFRFRNRETFLFEQVFIEAAPISGPYRISYHTGDYSSIFHRSISVDRSEESPYVMDDFGPIVAQNVWRGTEARSFFFPLVGDVLASDPILYSSRASQGFLAFYFSITHSCKLWFNIKFSVKCGHFSSYKGPRTHILSLPFRNSLDPIASNFVPEIQETNDDDYDDGTA